MREIAYWWCDECGCEVDPRNVTYEELHDRCNNPVEWIVEKEQTP